MALVFPLLMLQACGGEEAVTFRGRNAADWSAALTDMERRQAALEELHNGGIDALPLLRALLLGDEVMPALAAADLIGGLGPRGDAAVPELIRALDREKIRGLAATTLGRIGRDARAALDALREWMADKDPRMAMASALACWRIAEEAEAIPVLLRGLDSNNPGVRQMSIDSLGHVGKPAVDALATALSSDDPNVRAAAADALGAIGPDARKARRALYEALKDSSAIVRSSVEQALERLRD